MPKRPKLPNMSNLSSLFPRLPMPAFGDLLRNHRTMRGLTTEQVAAASGLAESAVRNIENGARLTPPQDCLKKLAELFQLGEEERETFFDAAEYNSGFASVVLGFPQPEAGNIPQLTASILVFLIADVRGYTHFTQASGDAAAARLTEKFASIARSVVEQREGRLVEIRGDEVLAVFGSAQLGLQAAMDMQARFAEATVVDPALPLFVGIGLDVGEAVPVEDGGYRGAALNRAARLCSLAGAGEVLVTSGLAYVAPMVDDVVYVELGPAQLKGFTEPANVLRVTSAAPAVAALEEPEG